MRISLPTSLIETTTVSNIGLLVVAIAIAQGIQLLRGFLASFSVYLNQIRDIDPVTLSGIVLLIFLSGAAAPFIRRRLGARRGVIVIAATLTSLRLAEQFVSTPDARLIVETLGVIAWLSLLLLITVCPWQSGHQARRSGAALGILLGLTIDTAIFGAFGTLDPAFSNSTTSAAATVAIAATQIGMITWLSRQRFDDEEDDEEPVAPPSSAACIGPILVLEMLIFQNLARLTVLTGWELPLAFAWTMAANVLAIWLAVALSRRGSLPDRWAILGVGVVLLQSVGAFEDDSIAIVAALAGPIAIAILLSWALAVDQQHRSSWPGPVLFLLLIPLGILGWYARYEIDIPLPQEAIILIVAALALLPVLIRSRCADRPIAESDPQTSTRSSIWFTFPADVRHNAIAVILPISLMLLPAYLALSWNSPDNQSLSGDQLRVVTYNMHQGFDVHGMPSLEEVAALLASEQPDVVALQEAPRGWLVNGGTDSLSWLAQQLGMHSAWGPATDRFWGNAVLSRYPIANIQHWQMPNNDVLRLNRSVLVVTIDVAGKPIQVVATHLHHIQRESHHRLTQIDAILEHIDWNRPSLLLGDLNTQPHHEELRRLSRAGIDLQVASDSDRVATPTYPADRPRRQIDYILSTDHFSVVEHRAIKTETSDHLPLLAVLTLDGRN